MPRLFIFATLIAISTMYLQSDRTFAQESKQECSKCPATQSVESRGFKIDLPGVKFPFGVHVAVAQDEQPTEQGKSKHKIELRCECKHSAGVPFLSNLPLLGNSFVKVGIPSNPPCCPASSEDGCKPCEQGSKGEKCEGCPIAQAGVPINNLTHDRLFTNVGHAMASPCKACKQEPDCKKCEGCPSSNFVKTIRTTPPNRVQLVGYAAPANNENRDSQRSESRDEMFELRVQNERLKMEVEAAECRLELMQQVFEVQVENAILQARIEFLESHHGNAAKNVSSSLHAR